MAPSSPLAVPDHRFVPDAYLSLDQMSQIPSRPRLESIDVLRGVVMIIMALDHTRDFFGTFGANPTNLATTTAPLFFTRWITHICAPTFFLLTGTGAGLASASRSRSELSVGRGS